MRDSNLIREKKHKLFLLSKVGLALLGILLAELNLNSAY